MFLAYAPLLRDQAYRLGVPRELRAELVTTVLDDVALHLQGVSIPPRDLGSYLVAAVRNRARSARRARERHEAGTNDACSFAGGAERVVAECHSEYAVRAASPEVDPSTALRRVINELASHAIHELSETELQLVIGITRRVPMREVAAQLGLTYGAARVRVHRLRERVFAITRDYVASLPGDEKHEVERFLRRAGIDQPSTDRDPQ